MTYINTLVNYNHLHHLQHCNVESVWLELKLKHAALILVGFIYRNPDDKSMRAEYFSCVMDDVLLEAKKYMLLGDFNFDLFKQNKH